MNKAWADKERRIVRMAGVEVPDADESTDDPDQIAKDQKELAAALERLASQN